MIRGSIFVVALLTLAFVPNAYCGVLTSVSIYDFSSEFPAFGRVANNTINGNGLVGDLHEWSDGLGMWHTQFGDFVPGESNFAHITFDLGAVYNIDQIDIWNYGEVISGGTRNSRRGVKDFRISVASSINSPNFTSIGDYTLSLAPIHWPAPYFAGESFAVSERGVRLVRFDIFSDHWDGTLGRDDVVGLSEVRFSGNLSAVPEPSSASLAVLAMSSFIFRSRRS